MILKFSTLDLLTAPEKYIVHQVNCQGVMDYGIAKQIKIKYPKCYTQYKILCDSFIDKTKLLGEAQIVQIDKNKSIINLFGQEKYGTEKIIYSDYSAINKALKSIKKQILLLEFKNYDKNSRKLEIAFPYNMSSFRSGAKWDRIYKLIISCFEGTDFIIHIYKYDK